MEVNAGKGARGGRGRRGRIENAEVSGDGVVDDERARRVECLGRRRSRPQPMDPEAEKRPGNHTEEEKSGSAQSKGNESTASVENPINGHECTRTGDEPTK